MTIIQGSFRGVPFGTVAHSVEGGRRTVAHEFPFRDIPFIEDLGLKTRTFSMDLFVLGDDVSAARDALIVALEKRGPGVLSHPYLGVLTVQVMQFTLSESYDEQRIAKFSVGFAHPGKLESPKAKTSSSGSAANASLAASIQASSNAAKIDVKKSRALTDFSGLVNKTSSLVQTSARQAAQPSSLPIAADRAAALESMSAFTQDAQALEGLVPTPDLLCFSLSDIVFRLPGLGMTNGQAFAAYERLLGEAIAMFGSQHYPETTIGLTMAGNASLFQDALYTAIVGSAAASAVDAAFRTNSEALAARKSLSDMFSRVMAVVTDDVLFGHLQDLVTLTLVAIPNPDQALPNMITMPVPAPLPSLVLAYDLMAGSKDEKTLIDLNGVRNPWFVGGGPSGRVEVLR